MVSNPNICECGSQLFVAVRSVEHKDSDTDDTELDPTKGNTLLKPVGFECVECGDIQLTREIPERHASDESMEYPDAANRDLVHE